MVYLLAVLVEDHAHGDAGPRLALLQRAEVVGDALGQHRHHAVGEIDGVAAGLGFLVQRGAGADIGRYVGDGDDHDPAALVVGVWVGFGEDRVVMVAGVGGIDGEEGNGAQILPPLQVRRLGGVRFPEGGVGEGVGDAMGMDGDEARGPLVLRITEAGGNAGCLLAEARRACKLEADELAILSVLGGSAGNTPFLQLLAVDGVDDAAAGQRTENAELGAGGPRQALDRARVVRVVGVGALRRDLRQHAVAQPGGRTRLAAAIGHQNLRGRPLLFRPGGGAGDELPIGIAGNDLDHGDGGQGAGPLELAARARDQPFIGHVAQQPLQRHAVAAPDAEGARDLALAHLRACAFEEVEDLLLRGELGHEWLGHKWFARGGLARSGVALSAFGHEWLGPGGLGHWWLRHGWLGHLVTSALQLAVSSTASLLVLLVLRALRTGFFAGPLASRAAISSTASAMVSCSGLRSLGRVALTLPCLT